jgi:hypothetical protein
MKYAIYAWIIDTDHIDAGHDNGTIGPRNVSPLMEQALKSSKMHGIRFKLYDDDGELYYSGRILLDLSDPDQHQGDEQFAPLDDFGMPNAGCTSIHYQNTETKKWDAI